tara:strand:- start:2300 stop:2512 length:213 start_codon:yes stop_codon:yes gene_type:complete
MGKMGWISYLCEHEMKDELIKNFTNDDLIKETGKTPEEIADSFISSYKSMSKKMRNENARINSIDKTNKI